MTGTAEPSVGDAMAFGLRSLARRDFPSQQRLAVLVGPHPSSAYGWRSVQRLLEAGLARLDPSHPSSAPGGSGAVLITEKGRAWLRAMSIVEVLRLVEGGVYASLAELADDLGGGHFPCTAARTVGQVERDGYFYVSREGIVLTERGRDLLGGARRDERPEGDLR